MSKLLEKFQNIWKTKDIRSKIIFSIIVLIVYRLFAAIPVVGIPGNAIVELLGKFKEGGDLLSTVSGGVLETASIVAIGLTPYINASIIFQLLGSVIPKLEELRKEGPQGRRTISMYTRLATVPLAILQSFVIYSTLRGFGLVGQLGTLELIAMSATLTAGSTIMMWIAELISEDGLGGGSSYLIFLGIIAGIPGTIRDNLIAKDWLEITIFVLISLLLVVVVIFVSEAERRIVTQYSRRVRQGGAMDSFIPLKLTQTGVMPVIFAVSLLSFPQLIAQFVINQNYSERVTDITTKIFDLLNNQLFNNLTTFLLIVGFSFFYLTVVFNTDELAENLQKQGAFIPGIRPGKTTAQYLRKVSFRLTAVGSLFLGFIAVLPTLLVNFNILTTTIISGTGLLIAVSTLMEVKRQVESMAVVRSYDKYL